MKMVLELENRAKFRGTTRRGRSIVQRDSLFWLSHSLHGFPRLCSEVHNGGPLGFVLRLALNGLAGRTHHARSYRRCVALSLTLG